MAERHGLNPQEVVEACVDGIKAVECDTGVRTNAIGRLIRSYGGETCQKELNAILACRDGLIAVDLAGDEAGFPAELFIEHFKQVRDAYLHVTIHADEATGANSVWSAIRDLGAERIGYGFRSIEDPALVEYLAEQRIGLESRPTSNLHISAVESYRVHPVKALVEQRVKICLNTDDPRISNINLRHEYEVAAPATGPNPDQIRQAQINAVDMAFLSQEEKVALRA